MRNLKEEWKKFKKDYGNFVYWTHYKKEVPSFKLCCKLKELGFPQTTPGLFWLDYREYIPEDKPSVKYVRDIEEYQFHVDGFLMAGESGLRGRAPAKLYKAPTIGELLRELPRGVTIIKEKDEYHVWIEADSTEGKVSIAERIENALAEQYCYIVKEEK